MPSGVFITSTGTGAGKTFVARGLIARLRFAGIRIVGLKPVETGCRPFPEDARALARAAGVFAVVDELGFHRNEHAVAPYAAELMGAPPLVFSTLVESVKAAGAPFEFSVVEGAGGLLVPLDSSRDAADLAAALAFPILLVAANRLGVLSHVRATVEAALTRRLPVAAVVLTEVDRSPDASAATNARILRERLDLPVLSFPYCADDDRSLAAAAEAAGIVELLSGLPGSGLRT
jgi:dethiobiotin synthetase